MAVDGVALVSLEETYRFLHRNPELSFQEFATAALVKDELGILGFEVVSGLGVTGVVGVLRNGVGPTVMLRADMDALPVEERTGLGYSSTVRGTDAAGNNVPVMHACGHDMHTVCLMGAARTLVAERASWAGTVIALFQSAEELGAGAAAMIADGLLERIPRPDVVLGQHVSPLPAGVIALQPGTAFAGADGIKITLYGRGGHGSRPETTVDPVVMAANTVLLLQTIVSREVAAAETVVLTVGSLQAGTKNNIIPDSAELLISLRTVDADVRGRVIAAIRRIAAAVAIAAGAPREPIVDVYESFPAVSNDPAAAERTHAALAGAFGEQNTLVPGAVTGSEDVGLLASASGAPCSFWLIGGSDPTLYSGAKSTEEILKIVGQQPSNHSPLYAPVIQPTLSNGIHALVAAAREWLGTTAQ